MRTPALRTSLVSTASLVSAVLGLLPLAGAAEPLPTVPEGFSIEIAAGPPVVERPVMANFDDRGRLYVVDSAGVNLPFAELRKAPPHRIVILEDTDGDGRFDHRQVFADKLVMPQGVLWHEGAAYTASPPSVWKLEDTDGDGVADRRTEIVTEFGATGNAADIHGPFLGPDGWLYLCDGRHGHKVLRDDGQIDAGQAGGIFRFRPDGSGFERYCGGGFDNPVEIDFLPSGEMLGTVNILLGNPRSDCLMHWVDGGVYPRHDQEQCIAEFKRTGDLLPAISELGHVAVSGMTLYRGDAFGESYRNNVFITLFNRHKLIRSIVERSGSSFRARHEDFLVSEARDFHPTDVLEDADGSLLVVDTGGWFRIGCPESQLAKPEVFGAIYRIRRNTTTIGLPPAELSPTEDITGFPAGRLAELLNDPRPSPRLLAQLAIPKALPALEGILRFDRAGGDQPQPSVVSRQNVVRVLTRVDDPAGARLLAVALRDPSPDVRQLAARSCGLPPLRKGPARSVDAETIQLLTAMVVGDEPPVQREVATTLGRICAPPDAGATRSGDLSVEEPSGIVVGKLFETLRAATADRFLEHALLYAAIRIRDRDAVLPFLKDASPRVRRGALIVLDQMDGGDLTRELVTPLLDTDDRALQAAALDVIGRRPGWAAETLGLLREWLAESKPTAERLQLLRGVLLSQATAPEVQALVSETLSGDKTAGDVRLTVWEVIRRAPLSQLPASWDEPLAMALNKEQGPILREVVAIVRERELDRFDARLVEIAGSNEQPLELRLESFAAAAPRLKTVSPGQFDLLMESLAEEAGPLARLTAARGLGDAPLNSDQLYRLAQELERGGPLAIPLLLRAFARTENERIGRAWVTTLSRAPAAANLSADELAGLLRKYPESVQTAAAPLLSRLGANLEEQRQRLEALSPALTGGDADRGRKIFFGQRAACASCHTIGGEGGKVGPDLTRIGGARKGRDLLEAVVFPSASFAREFRTYNVATTAGKVHSGVISRQTADAIYLRTAELAELRIPRSDIDELTESATSIMPKGLDQVLTPAELADLLEYLQQQK